MRAPRPRLGSVPIYPAMYFLAWIVTVYANSTASSAGAGSSLARRPGDRPRVPTRLLRDHQEPVPRRGAGDGLVHRIGWHGPRDADRLLRRHRSDGLEHPRWTPSHEPAVGPVHETAEHRRDGHARVGSVQRRAGWVAHAHRWACHGARCRDASSPDIYLVLLDAYPRSDTLATDFAFENEPFLGRMALNGLRRVARKVAPTTTAPGSPSRRCSTWPTVTDLPGVMGERPPSFSQLRAMTDAVNRGSGLGALQDAGYEIDFYPLRVLEREPRITPIRSSMADR